MRSKSRGLEPVMAGKPRILFITGTDTGVGKTVLTGLLLSHLRQTSCPALALKPFCSGGRAAAELLLALQRGDLALDEINPFHFTEPLAPLVAARLHRRKIPMSSVLASIGALATRLASPEFKVQSSKFKVQSSTPVLLIEGAGGLVSPLGEPTFSRITYHASRPYTALDLITALSKPPPASRFTLHASRFTLHVIVVAPNRLGTINHTLLTLDKLRQIGIPDPVLVLNDLLPERHAGLDSRYNGALLSEMLRPLRIVRLPYLGKVSTAREIQNRAKKLRKPLRKILKTL